MIKSLVLVFVTATAESLSKLLLFLGFVLNGDISFLIYFLDFLDELVLVCCSIGDRLLSTLPELMKSLGSCEGMSIGETPL